MLRERLVQCGWRDELKEYCKEVIRKKGLEKVTVEELVADITPQGRGTAVECYSQTMIYHSFAMTLHGDQFNSYRPGRHKSRASEENQSVLAINLRERLNCSVEWNCVQLQQCCISVYRRYLLMCMSNININHVCKVDNKLIRP